MDTCKNKAMKFLENKGYPNRLMVDAQFVKDYVYVSDVMMEFIKHETEQANSPDAKIEPCSWCGYPKGYWRDKRTSHCTHR